MSDKHSELMIEMNRQGYERVRNLQAQRDALLAAAKAAKPYLEDRILNDYIDIDNVREKLRQAITACEKP